MRYFTLYLLLIFQAFGHAQLQRGDRLLEMGNNRSFTGSPSHPLNGDNLANLRLFTGYFTVDVASGVTYGYLLHHRWAVGAFTYADALVGEGDRYTYFGLYPYLRYYAVNTDRLMAFGELSSGWSYSSYDDVSMLAGPTLAVGMHYSITPGVLLTPRLSYSINDDWPNTVALGGGVSLVLGRNNRPEERPVVRFERGDLLLGSQFVHVTSNQQISRFGLDLGGYYFLNDRLAVGGSVSTTLSRIVDFPSNGDRSTDFTVGVGAAARYYLVTGRRLGWFGELGANYGNYIRRFERGNSGNWHSGWAAVGLGAQFFIRDNVSLEVVPQVRHLFNEYESQRYGPHINFGVRFLL